MKQISLAITKKLESKFRFPADINVTTRENAASIMGLYPKWYYFNRPTNMAFHNLTAMAKTSTIPVQQIKFLLGLGLKCCPTPRYTTRKKPIRDTTLTQFRRNLLVKGYHAGQKLPTNNNFNKKMYIASKWEPPPWTIPWHLDQRISDFEADVQQLYTKKLHQIFSQHSLTPYHYFKKTTTSLLSNVIKTWGLPSLKLRPTSRRNLMITFTTSRHTGKSLKKQSSPLSAPPICPHKQY
eukprot:12621977-Ditylum_brightwellii.AAC.1